MGIVHDEKGRILKAGMIVTRNDNAEVLLTYRTKLDDYSFPKGHVEVGETVEQTAIRETEEETGYEVRIIKELESDSYQYPEGPEILVRLFWGEVVSQGTKIEDDEEPLWLKIEDVRDKLSYDNLKVIFDKFVRELEND